MYQPSDYFDFEPFSHKELLLSCAVVWEIVSKIKVYINSLPLGKIEVVIPNGVYLENQEQISIGQGCIIEPGAYIKGPCIIGKNCQVRQGAYIRGDFIAGEGCVIGHDTEVKNTLFLDGAQAAHFAYLGDCILGNRVNLGAGTKCANLRLDHGMISVRGTSTGLKKLGAIIGDRSQLGCNSVTNPGTLIGKECFAYPCTNFGGVVPANSTIQPTSFACIRSSKKK